MTIRRGMAYTNEEVEFLKDNYHKLGCEETSRQLGRSPQSVRGKASDLGIKGRRLTVAEKYRTDGFKACSKCGEVKPLEEFSQAKRFAYNRNSWCKLCVNSYGRERRKNNPEVSKRAKESHYKSRIQVMLHYCKDNILECACCGQNEPRFLCLDHIDGGGNAHRKSIGGSNRSAIWWWLKKNGYPPGFQVLCHNCNMAKAFSGICPHEEARQKSN